MRQAFEDLSPEGKLAKIMQHVTLGHPVKSVWVEWLLKEFVPQNETKDTSELINRAFQELVDEQKLVKIQQYLHEGYIPAPWVTWLLDEYLPSQAVDPVTRVP